MISLPMRVRIMHDKKYKPSDDETEIVTDGRAIYSSIMMTGESFREETFARA
jgi:hypothetical protein